MPCCFVTLPFVVRAVQPLLIEMDREMEEAAASLGAGGLTIFRRIIFPNLLPGIAAGVALAFARALGEYGSLVLISGEIPFKTEVSSVFIFKQIESGNTTGAAAVSVVLLAVSLLLLATVSLVQRWGVRQRQSDLQPRRLQIAQPEPGGRPRSMTGSSTMGRWSLRVTALGYLTRAPARPGRADLLQDLRTRPRGPV